jgi:hypothetical protein
MVRLPFTRSVHRPGFRPDRCRWRASLSPRTFYRLLQYDDARAPTASCFVPRAARRSDVPLFAFAFVRPLAGTTRADEPRSACLRRGMCRVDRTGSSEGSRRRFGGRSPSLNQCRAPRLSCERRYERRNLSRIVLTPDASLRASAGEDIAEASASRTPREGSCVPTKTEVRSTAVRLHELEDRSPSLCKRASRPRSTCAPKNTDALQLERACAFSTTARCPA